MHNMLKEYGARSQLYPTITPHKYIGTMKLFCIFGVFALAQETGDKCKETALNMACVTECNIEWAACQGDCRRTDERCYVQCNLVSIKSRSKFGRSLI